MLAVNDASLGGPALFVGGVFDSIGGLSSARNMARWNGTSWSTIGTGVTATGVNAFGMLSSTPTEPARLVIAGGFNGIASPGVAAWDGAAWTAMPGLTSAIIESMIEFDDGMSDGPALYVGGYINTQTLSEQRIMRWRDGVWSPLPGVTNNSVRALALFDENRPTKPSLYMGGYFVTAGSKSAWHISSLQPCDQSVPGDVNDDGHVNVTDLLAIISAWGPCPAPPASCAADIAPTLGGDGVVNVSDLLLVIANWGV